MMKDLIYTGVAFYKLGDFFKFTLIFSTASLMIPLTPFFEKLKDYLTPNLDSLVIFVILMLLDVISGIYKHSAIWSKTVKNTLSKDDFFYKLLKKVFAAAVWLTLVNAVEKYASKSETAAEYLQYFGTSVLISWMAWSIAENIAATTNQEFPPLWLMKKLKRVKDTGNLTDNTNNDAVN